MPRSFPAAAARKWPKYVYERVVPASHGSGGGSSVDLRSVFRNEKSIGFSPEKISGLAARTVRKKRNVTQKTSVVFQRSGAGVAASVRPARRRHRKPAAR